MCELLQVLTEAATKRCFDLVVKALDFQSRGRVFKTTGDSKVDSAFHPSNINKMSTTNFWELSGEK